MKLSTTLLLSAASHALVLPFLDQYEFELPSFLGGGDDEPAAVPEPRPHGELAPLVVATSDRVVAHQYIVVLNDEFAVQDMSLVATEVGATDVSTFAIGSLVNGFVARMGPDMVEHLRQDSRVQYIEQDSRVELLGRDVQPNAPWGLLRISHRKVQTDSLYRYDDQAGLGVDAYVVDTGVKVELEEFEGRAEWAKAVAFPGVKFDANGHGTHCAGIIGLKTYGVAKQVNIYAVGVMSPVGTGTTSDIIKGLEVVASLHAERKSRRGFKGSTVNMSLGGGVSEAFDQAVNALVNLGIHVAVAAGNDNADACEYSPARAEKVITVGASNSQDERASFSNWGKCVDVFAPGQDIELTYIWSPTTVMSGTLMASPHVAGLLSYYLSLAPDPKSEFAVDTTPEVMKKRLLKYSTKGALTQVEGSPNLLIYNGAGKNLTDFYGLL